MLEGGRRAYQQQLGVGVRLEEMPAGGQRDTRAVVAAHAIDSQGGRHGLNCRAKQWARRTEAVKGGQEKGPACGAQPGPRA